MKFSLQIGGFTFPRVRQVAPVAVPASPPVSKQPTRLRSFPGAIQGRLTADWAAPSTSADAEILSQRRMLIYRCRQLERENDYVRRYFKLVENNVLGADG